MRRIAALLLALTVPTAIVNLPAAASAATKPTVTKFSATAGPLGKNVSITLTGKNLDTVKKARFGRTSSTISSKRSTSLVLKVPRKIKATVSKVQLFSAGKWRTVGSYRYVAKPSISSLSKTTGQLLGGQSIVVKGKALDRVQSVVMSGAKAKITRRTATSLTITTPPSVPGTTSVTVVSPGGSTAKPFSYKAPAPSASATIRTLADTFAPVVDQIQWVFDSEDEGYVVSLAPGATLPSVGDPFYLAAGSTVYPSGLAGKVESLAAQPDSSTRVVVKSVQLSEIFTDLDVNVTDDVSLSSFSSGALPTGRASAAAAPSGSLGKASRSAFSCDRDVDFKGEVEIKVSDLNPHFETKGFGNPFKKNEVIAYVSGKTEVSGSLKAEGSLECDLNSSWQNSHRKVVSLAYGVTYSIAPEVHLSISASGSVSIKRSQTFLYGTQWAEDTGGRKIQDLGNPQVTVEGKLAGSVSIEAGVSNRIGLLDRVGVEVEGLLYVDGEASFTLGSTGKFCLEATYGLKAPVKLFLDVWIDEETTTLFTIVIQFGSLKKCGQVYGVPDTNDPQISSTQLADATVGAPYSDSLATSDNRVGTWRTTSALPPGLSLGQDGSVTGRPTGGIGTRYLVVTFEDSEGRLATSTISLRVRPSSGLGGGDIQATLTWSNGADLDLHAYEPSGSHIYYGNRGPTDDNGGELDRDANPNCGNQTSTPAENIYWPAGRAESGDYFLRVETYNSCGESDLSWRLQVRVRGQVIFDQTGFGTSEEFVISYVGGEARVAAARRSDAGERDYNSPPKG